MIKKEIEKIMKKNIKDIRIIFQATKDGTFRPVSKKFY